MRLRYLIHTILILGSPFESQPFQNRIPATPLTTHHRSLSASVAKQSSQLITSKNGIRIEDSREVQNARQWLQEYYHFTDNEINQLFATTTPSFLALKASIIRDRAKWMQARLSLSKTEMKRMLQQKMNILTYDTSNNLSALDYLQERLLLNDATLTKAVKRFPDILGYSVEGDIEPTLDWLKQRLKLSETKVAKIVAKDPIIFGRSIETNLEPKLVWLQNRLNLTEKQLNKMIQRLPIIFSYSIEENIEPKLVWIEKRFHLNTTQSSKMIQRLPSIFCYSIDDKINPTLKWLRHSLLLDDAALSRIIVAQPSLLGCSIPSNLEPTLNFYVECLKEKEEVRDLLTRHPVLFLVSLEKRLKPRLKQAKESRMTIDKDCLTRMGKYTDLQWQSSQNRFLR